ncbi:hypothetical protein Tco_0298338 [Tanacetum coccineum]
MVAYLKKPEGSEGFHKRVDFLNANHIRQESVVPQPRSLTQSPVADEAASTSVDVRYGGATTIVTGLEVGQGSGNIDKTPTMPHDSPLPRVNTLGSDEGSMTLQELMVYCKTLSKKVESFETYMKQTKLTYDAAYTKLIKKVKKLENKFKSSQARRRARIIVSDDEDDLEDPSKQGRKIAKINQDPAISLVQHDAEIQGRHEHDMEFDFDLDAAKDVSTGERMLEPITSFYYCTSFTTASVAAISTASPTRRVSTADDITMAETLVYIRKSAAKDKAAVRLQAELEEEKRQRIARVYEAASSFNVEEWEDIQARVEADEKLAQRLQVEEREMYTEAEQARMHVRCLNSIQEKHMGSHTLQQLKGDKEEELNQESSKRQKTGKSSQLAEEQKDKEEELSQEELQQMMIIVPEQRMNKLQKHIHDLTWRLYDSCGVHHVSTKKGIDIYMLVEMEYLLSRGTLTLMLVAKLLVEQDNEMSRELLRKIFMQAERLRR